MALIWLAPLAAAVVGLLALGLLVRALRREVILLAGAERVLEADRERLGELRAGLVDYGRPGRKRLPR